MAPFGLIDKVNSSNVPLKGIQIRAKLQGFTAEVVATMEYSNQGNNPIEAIYVFPLDEEAAVCGFQATIDGRTIVAEIQEKQEARDTYDDAISSGHSAFLLEESDESSDIFQINVGNLPPRQSGTVQLTFVTTLTVEKEGRVVFVLPTVLNPRYSPSDSNPSVSTTMRSIASVSTKYSFDFELDVQCASPIQEITSPCNRLKVDINPQDHCQAIVRLGEDYKFDADVQVHVLCSKPFEPCALVENGVTCKSNDGKKDEFLSKPVVMLNFFPSFDSCASLERGEFIFVVDRSESMSGSKIKSAKQTLLLFLKSLPESCFFNVVGFGSSFEKLFHKSESYNDSNIDLACSHAESMEANLGGTDILTPLRNVFSQPLIQGYPRQIFVLTDGKVGNTQQVIELVRKNANKARCFTIGIGAGASSALVKGVARAGKGMYEFVESGDKMQAKVIKLLKNALQPALSNCTVTWDLPNGCVAKSIPEVPPPIFSGNSLIMYGLITDDSLNTVDSTIKGSVTLSATLASGSKVEKIKHKLSLEDLSLKSEDHSLLLHRLASKAWIQEKQDDSAGNAAVDEEIVQISKSANVVSKLTSFVAVDKDTNKPVSSALVTPLPNRNDYLGRLLTRACSSYTACGAASHNPTRPTKIAKKGGISFGNPLSKFFGSKSQRSKSATEKCRRQQRPTSLLSQDRANHMNELKSGFENLDCTPDRAISFRRSMKPKERNLHAQNSFLLSLESPRNSVTEGYLSLISLQKASGAWQLTAELANVCGVTLDKLKQTCPSQLTTDNKDSLWATAIALSCLAGKFADQKDEWEMVAAKGTKWLKAKLSTESLSYHEIMDFASRFLARK